MRITFLISCYLAWVAAKLFTSDPKEGCFVSFAVCQSPYPLSYWEGGKYCGISSASHYHKGSAKLFFRFTFSLLSPTFISIICPKCTSHQFCKNKQTICLGTSKVHPFAVETSLCWIFVLCDSFDAGGGSDDSPLFGWIKWGSRCGCEVLCDSSTSSKRTSHDVYLGQPFLPFHKFWSALGVICANYSDLKAFALFLNSWRLVSLAEHYCLPFVVFQICTGFHSCSSPPYRRYRFGIPICWGLWMSSP